MRHNLALLPLLNRRTFLADDGEQSFCCHNKPVVFGKNEIDWRPADQTRLWCYNLHYFDTLRDPDRSVENKCWLVADWIFQNPQNSQPAWEPFTVSLRIVNWVAFFSVLKNEREIPQFWLDSLYEQVLWLEKNDERHILANHYFENIKAWCFAGFFFSGEDADRWLAKSEILMAEQLKEQFLTDGAHYERSPQYHSIMVCGCLDLLNLASSNAGRVNAQLVSKLRGVIENGMRWLSAILRPDDRIPLFNDSSFGVGPSYPQLAAYAASLNIAIPKRSDVAVVEESDSGLYGYKNYQNWLLIKCSDVGPEYQPGHTNCDLLSYELMLGGVPVIVNTGVYEYEPGEMRQYVRSTRAHNTCAVNGVEQSEIWGEFRVARRAKRLHARINWQDETQKCLQFTGAYHGFFSIKPGAEHQRQLGLELDQNGSLIAVSVSDTVTGEVIEGVESFIHFHPDISVVELEHGTLEIAMNSGQKALLQIEDNLEYSLEPSIYCPEFGKKLDSEKIVLRIGKCQIARLSYRIEVL